jgi:hypothetical protein
MTAASIRLVGVAVNTDLDEGMRYLNSFGAGAFDEVSLGDGWQNEHITRLIWRDTTVEAAVPQVIVLTRNMSASIKPMILRFTTDSVIAVILGASELKEFVSRFDTAHQNQRRESAGVGKVRARGPANIGYAESRGSSTERRIVNK